MSFERVWITGADGFTGQYVVAALKAAGMGIDTTEVDITDAERVKQHINTLQPEAVIHLAAISFVPDGVDTSIYAVNSFGTQNILDACHALPTPPKRIILASSANVYGRQQTDQLSETDATLPVNHYGYSKWVMERIAAGFADKLNITITRPFNYTGVGQQEKFLVPKLVAHFRQKKATIQLGNIDVWRDFSDVRWVAEAYKNLLLLDTLPGIVNLCSQRLTSIREMLTMLETLSGHQIQIQQDPSLMRSDDIEKQCGNHQKLMQALPTQDGPIAIEQTLQWMLQQ